MKPVTLHPVCLALGVALASLFALPSSAVQVPSNARPIPTISNCLPSRIPAGDWVFVRVRAAVDGGGTVLYQDNYTVPTDRYFVVTALSHSSNGLDALLVNGANDRQTIEGLGIAKFETGLNNYGTRFVLPPGTTLSEPAVQPGTSFELRLWGYLEPL